MIDLLSAIHYWAEDPWPSYWRPLQDELADMRRFGVTLKFRMEEYHVLHPYPLVHIGDKAGRLPDLELV